MDEGRVGRGRREVVDDLAPEKPSALYTLATLAAIWSTPWVALAITAWVSILMG